MRRVKRYRRISKTRALKQWSPWYVLDRDEVTSALVGGGW